MANAVRSAQRRESLFTGNDRPRFHRQGLSDLGRQRVGAGTVAQARRILGKRRATELVETVKQVASQLGNTPAVCRQCYIHPAILQAFSDGELVKLRAARKRKWLSAEKSPCLPFCTKRPIERQHRRGQC